MCDAYNSIKQGLADALAYAKDKDVGARVTGIDRERLRAQATLI